MATYLPLAGGIVTGEIQLGSSSLNKLWGSETNVYLEANSYLYSRVGSNVYIRCGSSAVNMYYNLVMNSKKITSLLNPTDAQDAATKAYADLMVPLTQKDAVSGVCALDSSGNVIAPGNNVSITRNGSNIISIGDRTSSELAVYAERIDTNDWKGYIVQDAVGEEIITTGNISGYVETKVYSGLYANAPASPSAGTMYICTDGDDWATTPNVLYCKTAGTWEDLFPWNIPRASYYPITAGSTAFLTDTTRVYNPAGARFDYGEYTFNTGGVQLVGSMNVSIYFYDNNSQLCRIWVYQNDVQIGYYGVDISADAQTLTASCTGLTIEDGDVIRIACEFANNWDTGYVQNLNFLFDVGNLSMSVGGVATPTLTKVT
jgi:hypothetical protein